MNPDQVEVSLISSWHITPPREGQDLHERSFASLRLGLRQQIRLFDLYFLDHGEIRSFAHAARRPRPPVAAQPLDFAASLTPRHIQRIADYLTDLLAREFAGPRIGLRPRITALATYWPLLSLPDDECREAAKLRRLSIRAVQNSLRLATQLGCRHVEIVGGSGIPESARARGRTVDFDTYRDRRFATLADSLAVVFEPPPRRGSAIDRGPRAPVVTLEIEPGEPFLIRDVQSFVDLRRHLRQRSPDAFRNTFLNVDVAHMMLAEGGAAKQLEDIRRHRLAAWIGHMHASDHARTHASDLTPGSFHFFEDFRPWLELAAERTAAPSTRFSRCIAVEMEACNDVHEASRAVGRIRRWSDEVQSRPRRRHGGPPTSAQSLFARGALLVVDLGNSTEVFFPKGRDPGVGARSLEDKVSTLCREVHASRGSVLSFTGDGLVAQFDREHFLDDADTARAALAVSRKIGRALLKDGRNKKNRLTLRAALHWGAVYLPRGGPLRQQAIGRDVVLTCRLCDWIGRTLEPAVPERARRLLVGLTGQFHKLLLEPGDRRRFAKWGPAKFKGLSRDSIRGAKTTDVYVEKRCVLKP